MIFRTRAALLAVSLALPALGALPLSAQTADAPAAAPAPKRAAVHAKAAHPKKPAKPAGEAAAAPPAGSSILGSGSADSPLERRRKAFLANRPDEDSPEPGAPSLGATLGGNGSGGVSPGVGFKF